MLESIGLQMKRMVFVSMSSPSTPLDTLQGLLILCTWAAPLQSMTKDMTYVVCGASIHLAIQIGLHIPDARQDFVPKELRSNESDLTLRARLWSLACIVHPL
jgi:hypothetical protein